MPRKAVQENQANVYFAAAQEHKTLAVELHEAGRYVLSHYLAGLAVECILRAYRTRINSAFTARHDLAALAQEAGFDSIVPDEMQETIGAAFTEVVRRWSNSHRYRSERALRDSLRQAGLGRSGKYVRESSRRIINAAIVIVDQGVLKWND